MEYSSPLAAMRPQPAWGNRKDVPISRSMYSSFQTCGPNSFDFKSMSMHQKPQAPPQKDYFTLRPVRGSSPTSTLMADLDANFHIDKSPQAPTPRRSLFTTDLFSRPRDDAYIMTPPIESEGLTTPDVPSSSPYIDAMDISPLPHKAPHFQVTLPSPSPEGTPMLSEEISAVDLNREQRSLVAEAAPPPPSFLQLPERRRPVTRPSLFRSRTQGAHVAPQRPSSAETSLPAFRFGNAVSGGLSCSSTPSLLESFTESPVDEIRSPSGQPMPPSTAVRRPSLGATSRANGSPVTSHVRKPSGGRPAFVRPQRKVMRRSLSMFQHPDDVMQEEQDTFEPQPSLAAVMDVDQEHKPKLPHFFPADKHDGIPRISQDTMAKILEGQHNSSYDRVLVVDCRFEYEYKGGHVENAVNYNDKSLLANELFNNAPSGSTLLILHCEYSVHRAPMTASFIRSRDREVNSENYPNLTYPELYVLDGGYSQFYSHHRSKCFPQNYVEMNDQRHEQACERGMAKVKQRQKLFRHQTFAFGQGHDDMENSPTAMGRSHMAARSQSTLNVGCDLSEGIGQSYARRMASY